MSEKLTDRNLLEGESEEITMVELRSRPGDIITQVQMGKVFTVKKFGKAVAVISKPEPNALELGSEARRIEKWIARKGEK